MYEDIKKLYPEYNGIKGGRLKDLTGQKFGRLTVLYRGINTSVTDSHAKWVCQCECGNIKLYTSNDLRRGKVVSCGCKRREDTGKMNFIDETSNRYGKLEVIEYSYSDKKGHAFWKCKCDCGNICYAEGTKLRRKEKISCGCEQSWGNFIIEQILKELQLKYYKEYKIDKLIGTGGNPLRFDFAVVYNKNFLIEFDGKQHFQRFDWEKTDKEFLTRQQHDKMKTDYCKNNNIPLLRIDYTKNTKEKIEKEITNFILTLS